MDDQNCSKCKKKTKDYVIKCSGKCNLQFHLKCIDISYTDFQVTQNCKGMKWFCEGCLEALENIWGVKNEISDLQKQVSSEISELKNMINKIQSHEMKNNHICEGKTYAKVASEVVVIKPKNTGQESKKTLEMVQKHLNPTALEVGITEVRTVKEGGVVIKCNSKDEINKIKTAAEKKLGKNYRVNTPNLKNPNVKIVDIPREMESDELIEAIKKQNITLNSDSILNVKVIKKMKTKWMAILECDPESFKKIMQENGIYIDWSKCRVYEYINVFRCFKCGGYGHKSSSCNNSSSRCLRCAKPVGEHSSDKQCDCEHPKCVNCIDANAALQTKFNVNHSSFDINCPILLKRIEIQRRKIGYNVDSE